MMSASDLTRIQEFPPPNLSPLTQAVIWQYDTAPVINSLINSKFNWYQTNDEEFWSAWFFNVFSLITANNFGLSVWSIILNVPLFLNLGPPVDETDIFGFNSYDPPFVPPTLINTYDNFGTVDGFGSNFSGSGDSTILTTEEQRFLLRMKYYKLVSRGSIPQTNVNLNSLMISSVSLGAFSPTSVIANPITVTGNTASGSKLITSLSSTMGLAVGQGVIGTGIPDEAVITAIDVVNASITISLSATATNTGTTLDIGLPTAWVLENFGMAITYQFNFFLPAILQRALRTTDVLPNPAGVLVNAQYWDGSSYIDF